MWELIVSGIPNGIPPIGAPPTPASLDWSLPWGTIEELCKILVVVFVARWVPVKNARTGLFIGGAVGFGFSAWENVEYGLSSFSDGLRYFPYETVAQYSSHAVTDLSITTVVRELFGPFGHPLWTALLAAAVFFAYRDGRFRITRIVVLTFVAVTVTHTLWDFLQGLAGSALHYSFLSDVIGWSICAVISVAGALVWNTVRTRANRAAVPASDAPPVAPDPPIVATAP